MLLGLSGRFERFVRLIPPGIASGLLAGILLHFGSLAFGGAKVDPLLVAVLFAAYILLRRFTSRYAIVGILAIGLIYLIGKGKSGFQYDPIGDCITGICRSGVFTHATLGVALPLFIITLTGQYMPGMLVLRNDGFKAQVLSLVETTGESSGKLIL